MDLDPQLAALCDSAAAWLACASGCSRALGVCLPVGIAAMLAASLEAAAPRLHTGYAPKAQRNAAAHGLYCAGIRTPRSRVTAADKALAESKRWGLAS